MLSRHQSTQQAFDDEMAKYSPRCQSCSAEFEPGYSQREGGYQGHCLESFLVHFRPPSSKGELASTLAREGRPCRKIVAEAVY